MLISSKKLDPKLNAFADGFMTREISMSYGFVYIPEMVSVWRYYETSFSKSLALNENKYNKINRLYIKKIETNQSFTGEYLNYISGRLNFQRKLTYFNSKTFNSNLLKKIISNIFKIYYFILIRPIKLKVLIKNYYLYLIKNHFKNNIIILRKIIYLGKKI